MLIATALVIIPAKTVVVAQFANITPLKNHVIPSCFARDLTSDRTMYAAAGTDIPADHHLDGSPVIRSLRLSLRSTAKTVRLWTMHFILGHLFL